MDTVRVSASYASGALAERIARVVQQRLLREQRVHRALQLRKARRVFQRDGRLTRQDGANQRLIIRKAVPEKRHGIVRQAQRVIRRFPGGRRGRLWRRHGLHGRRRGALRRRRRLHRPRPRSLRQLCRCTCARQQQRTKQQHARRTAQQKRPALTGTPGRRSAKSAPPHPARPSHAAGPSVPPAEPPHAYAIRHA